MRYVFSIQFGLRSTAEGTDAPEMFNLSKTGICSTDGCRELLEATSSVFGFDIERFIDVPSVPNVSTTKVATMDMPDGVKLIVRATFEPYFGWDYMHRQHHMYRDTPDTDMSQYRVVLPGIKDAYFFAEGVRT